MVHKHPFRYVAAPQCTTLHSAHCTSQKYTFSEKLTEAGMGGAWTLDISPFQKNTFLKNELAKSLIWSTNGF